MVLDQYLSTYTHDFLWPCNLNIPEKCKAPVIVQTKTPSEGCVCTMRPSEYLELLRLKFPNLDQILKVAPPAVGVRKRRWPPGHKVTLTSTNEKTAAEKAPFYERPKEKPFPCKNELFDVFPGNLQPTPEPYVKIPRRLEDDVLVTIDPMEDVTEYRATISNFGKKVLDSVPVPPENTPFARDRTCSPFKGIFESKSLS